MALHNLKITVVDGGQATSMWGSNSLKNSNANDGGTQNGNKDSKMYKILNLNDTIKGKVSQAVSPTTMLAIQSGISLATQTAKQTIDYYISDIGRSNGDSNYQAMVGRNIEKVTDVLSIGGGALGGAASGAVFGPIGAGIGAVVGAASSGISLAFKYAGRERDYAHTMFENQNSQAYNLARANYNITNGRMR